MSQPKPKRPNVLMIAVDDMNDWYGCLGKTPRALTPNMDRLAARGVCFRNAQTTGVWCAPARTALMTGQYPCTTGFYGEHPHFALRPDIDSLQTSFKKAGYRTFGTGKIYHHREGMIDPNGWDDYAVASEKDRTSGWPIYSWKAPSDPKPNPYPYGIYARNTKDHNDAGFMEWGPLANELEAEMADTIRADYAVSKIQEQHDEPFFIGMGLYSPHFPCYAPQKYFDLYDRDQIPLPPYKDDDREDLPEPVRSQQERRYQQYHKKLEEWDAVRDPLHAYLACMSYADAQIGRVLDALAASPYADNTIVVMWGDHGYSLGEKGHWGKHSLWQRSTTVPLLWAGPSIAQGHISDLTVSTLDTYPTLVELCDLPAPNQALDGESLAQTLAAPEQAADREVWVMHHQRGGYAVVNRDWRYICYENDSEELYDEQNDPNEYTNLAEKPEFAAIKADMRAKGPKEFAPWAPVLDRDKDLIVEGESYRWEIPAEVTT